MSTPAPRHHALLLDARRETPLLRHLRLEVPQAIREAHRHPGQFVEVSLRRGEAGAYFALANPTSARTFELLVKQGEGVAAELWGIGPGHSLWLSDPLGPGFPLDAGRGRDVFLFATGSGFAPIRALLHSILEEREAYGAVHLFFGVRTEADFPFAEELARLPDRGVHTHLTVSRRPEALRGHGRYVQERFLELMPPVEDAVAYLCGIEGMVRGVKEALEAAGMPSERIHVNL